MTPIGFGAPTLVGTPSRVCFAVAVLH